MNILYAPHYMHHTYQSRAFQCASWRHTVAVQRAPLILAPVSVHTLPSSGKGLFFFKILGFCLFLLLKKSSFMILLVDTI